MGSCISGNGAVYISNKKKNFSKNKKSVGCFTSLCKGEDDIIIENKNSSEIVPFPQIKSSFCISYKNDKLNDDLNSIIDKYKDKLKIQKIKFEQIYNIFMNYTYDFTKSNFILCDTRELSVDKKQLFLKKFPQINYNLKQLEHMKKEKINNFFNFLKGKNLIFILKEESSLDDFEKYLIFFLVNIEKCSFRYIYILNQFIKNYNETNKENSFSDYLYHFIDEDLLYLYCPKILINSNDIISSSLNFKEKNSNNAYIFYSTFFYIENNEINNNKSKKLKIVNKFDINYLNNKDIINTDIYLNFISKFKIEYIINFLSIKINDNAMNKNSFKYIYQREGKRARINKEEQKILIKQNNIFIPKNIEFDEFYEIIHNEFIPLLEDLKRQIIQNNCILIQFDNNIDNIFILKLIYIISFRTTGLTFDNIFNYLKCNFFDIGNEFFIKVKKEEIQSFLK